jgi:hypothetical protein
VRVPAGLAADSAAPLMLGIGGAASQAGCTLSVR